MADIRLDMQALLQLKTDLEAVVSEFTSADDFSDAVGEATGHDALRDHVRDFAHKWNDKRETMLEAVQDLQTKIEGITDGFTKVDASLTQALQDAATANGKPVLPEPPTMRAAK